MIIYQKKLKSNTILNNFNKKIKIKSYQRAQIRQEHCLFVKGVLQLFMTADSSAGQGQGGLQGNVTGMLILGVCNRVSLGHSFLLGWFPFPSLTFSLLW